MPNSDLRGRFVWYELNTTDPEAAKDFYTKLIGWSTTKFRDASPDWPPYDVWMKGEASVGGVMPLPEQAKQMGAPPHWLAYIGTPDVDQTVTRATELGAQVYFGPADIPTVGRIAVIADPQGAVFAAFTPASEAPAAEGPAKPGEFSWHELTTTDHEAAFNFYHELFGWEKQDAMPMGELGVYQMYGRNGTMLGGMYNRTPEMGEIPPNWLVYVKVDDVHKSVDEVKQNGGQVLNGPMEVPGGDWIAQCMDPQGAAFALHSTPAQA